ncbi:MAG: PqiC family protein [Rhodopila sp.]|nr:PqiC family protein [Rhodopila sp.]
MSGWGRIRAFILACAATSLVTGCAAPPLTLYSLGAPSTAPDAAPLRAKPIVIEIARVTVPDELDVEDIVVRDGSILRRSQRGRWASRLSLGITDRLTERLAERRPDALVTDRPQVEAPTYRVLINISRLDVTTAGVVTLEANWLIVPHDPAVATRRDRARFSATGPVATDQDVVTLVETVLDRLADAIAIPGRR